jgi:glycosyltransferase involved in cell wall biosynthesis
MRALCIVEHGGAPSTRLRLTDCIPEYNRLGVEVTVMVTRRSHLPTQRRIMQEARRHDVIVLFKTLGFSSLALRLLRRANPRIVFDFDDAVMFREQKHRKPLDGRNFRKFLRTMEICSAVVAGNSFLASFARACDRRTVILPTSIDLRKYLVKEYAKGGSLTIGWLGLSDGLPYLRQIEPALRRLAQNFPGLKLKVVSDKPLTLSGIEVQNELWQIDTEQTQLSSFDVGIMPLWDSVWTRGKCGYKILQYMGVGTAVVASPVGVNGEIIRSGENGFLARTEEDWVESIGHLIKHPEQRTQFGKSGRRLVEESYSLIGFAEGYVNLLREVGASSGPLDPALNAPHTP